MLYLVIFLFLSSCSTETTYSESEVALLSGNAMTIDYRIQIAGPLNAEKERVAQHVIEDTFSLVHRCFNNYNPDSELSILNQLPAHVETKLSTELHEMLQITAQVVELSGGLFDPTVAPLHKVWKDSLEKGQTPFEKTLEDLSDAIGWDKIHISNGLFHKDHPLTSLDLGGIAKGHCVDLLVKHLNLAGFENICVEWGGEFRASGQHPQGRPWKIFLSKLGSPRIEDSLAIVDVSEKGLAASGDYWQFWQVADPENSEHVTTYTHIVHPKTKQALQVTPSSVASCNILAPTCALADGLATTAMLLPSIDLAKRYLEQIQQDLNFQFWLSSRQDIDPLRDGEF